MCAFLIRNTLFINLFIIACYFGTVCVCSVLLYRLWRVNIGFQTALCCFKCLVMGITSVTQHALFGSDWICVGRLGCCQDRQAGEAEAVWWISFLIKKTQWEAAEGSWESSSLETCLWNDARVHMQESDQIYSTDCELDDRDGHVWLYC